MNDLTAYTILRNLLTDTAPFTGDAFLKASVKSFSRQFDADFVFITQAMETPPDTVKMLAAWREGQEISGWEFSLPGTPCELLYRNELPNNWEGMRIGSAVAIAENVCRAFVSTSTTTYESFIGVPLWSSDRKMIGHVALFFERQLTDGLTRNFILELVELYSYKVQAELNRMLLEQERERVLAELTKVNERLAHETTTDSLTQLYNRRYFTLRLQQTFARFKRYGESYALVLLDLDNFKNINDTCGHEFGDEVLRKVAAAFVEHIVNDGEMAFRIGGEEFAILCHSASCLDTLQDFGNRINHLVKDILFQTERGRVTVTVSIGAAQPTAEDVSGNAIYVRADAALYTAKKEGRDRTVVALI